MCRQRSRGLNFRTGHDRRAGSSRRGFFGFVLGPVQEAHHRCLELRQIVVHSIPDRAYVNSFPGMTELVPDAADVAPRLIGNLLLRLASEPGCCFTDDLQFALYR